MQINLNQEDVEQAIKEYAGKFGMDTSDAAVKIRRSAKGVFSAEVHASTGNNTDAPETPAVEKEDKKAPDSDGGPSLFDE